MRARSRRAAEIAAAVGLMLSGCSDPTIQPPEPITIFGDLWVPKDATSDACRGAGPYGPNVGSSIFIHDEAAGTLFLADGVLGYGDELPNWLDLTWSIDGIPGNRKWYIVQVECRTAKVDGDLVRRQERVQLKWEEMQVS